MTLVAFFHQQDEVRFPPVDSLCPFGTLESLYSLFFKGKFLKRVFSSSLILLTISIILIFFTGKSFCGYICPFGALQGIIGHLSSFFNKKKIPITMSRDRWFRYAKYPVLVIFTIGAWIGERLLIRPYDPWVAWMHLSEIRGAMIEFPIAVVILFLIITGSYFISRVFCRYLCPMGAFLSLLNKISPFQVLRDVNKCNDCKLCDKVCSAGIDVSSSTVMDKAECTSCGECLDVCSKKKAISFGYKKAGLLHGRIISGRMVMIIIISVYFGGVGLTKALGFYRSTNYSIDEMKKKKDLSPDDIKGYMTLKEVAEVFNLNLSELYSVLDLDYTVVPSDIKCKEIGELIGNPRFETDEIRIGVGKLLNIPEDQIQRSCSSGGDQSGFFIPGTMTLGEVSNALNIPPEDLYKELGLKMDKIPPSTQCRELKFIVNPDFHTTKVREAAARILEKRK